MRPKLPGRGPQRSALAARLGFLPCEGGRLELSGVFGSSPSFASSSAARATSVRTCAVSA